MTLTDHRPETAPPQTEPRHAPRRLTRSRTDRMIAGVCGGIAEYAGVDVNLVRLVVAAFALWAGAGIVLYVLAWLIIPEGDF